MLKCRVRGSDWINENVFGPEQSFKLIGIRVDKEVTTQLTRSCKTLELTPPDLLIDAES